MSSRFEQLRQIVDDLLNATVTQPFGPTTYDHEPAGYGYPHFHSGVDLALKVQPSNPDLSVRSFSSGRVVGVISDSTGYGNHVFIQSPSGYTYLYGHLHDFGAVLWGTPKTAGQNLQVGDLVHAGDIIGHEGSTGNSSGPHLHLEVRNPNGVPVDLGSTGSNIFYSLYHDLGFGAGYLPGQLDVIPAPTGTPDPQYYLPVPDPLPLNPASKDTRFAFGKTGILGPPDPVTGVGQPGTPGQPGYTYPGAPGYIFGQPASSSGSGAGTFMSSFFSFLNNPGGILGTPKAAQSASGVSLASTGNGAGAIPALLDPGKVVVFAFASIIGTAFILIGLVKLGKEPPVAVVVNPVVGAAKTAGKVAAVAA